MLTRHELKKIITLFLIYKVLILTVGTAAHVFVPDDIARRKAESPNPLLNAFAQLDARAYLDIAKNGYNTHFNGTSNYGWYPLYPLLIWLFSFVGFELAAFLIANAFSFLAVLMLYVLVRDELGRQRAERSVFFLLFFPSAFFLTAMYSESLFLFLSLAAFYLARTNRWSLAGTAGFLAALTRLQGVLLLLPLAYLYFKQRRAIDRRAAALLLIPLGLIAFMSYQYIITGDPFIQFYTQGKYQRAISLPFTSVLTTINGIFSEPYILDALVNAFNLATAALLALLLYLSHKSLKREYTLYFGVSLLLPFFSSSLASISRFGLVMFPAFMVLALRAEKQRALITALYAIFILAMIFGTVRYVNEDIIL